MTFKVEGLPASLRIGPHMVAIGRLSEEEAATLNGVYDQASIEVRILDSYPLASFAVQIVLHEVLHAVMTIANVDPAQGEEHIVEGVSTALTQVIRDNPEFINWLQQAVDK